MVKSHIYMVPPGSPGLWDCPNRAPNWTDIRLSRTALLFQRSHLNLPLLHISGLFTGKLFICCDLSIDMTIHFLHMEPSHPPTYYTDLYIYISRLHQSNKSTLFTCSCLTRLLSSRTQHRLTWHVSQFPPSHFTTYKLFRPTYLANRPN